MNKQKPKLRIFHKILHWILHQVIWKGARFDLLLDKWLGRLNNDEKFKEKSKEKRRVRNV